MLKIDRILLPTDFSEHAAFAYPVARDLAKTYGATVTAAHVDDTPVNTVGDAQLPVPWERSETEIAGVIERGLGEVRAVFGDIPFEAIHRRGNASTGLIDIAAEVKPDLIVMSTHGRTGLERLLMGSTAEAVVRRASCMVLTVHPDKGGYSDRAGE